MRRRAAILLAAALVAARAWAAVVIDAPAPPLALADIRGAIFSLDEPREGSLVLIFAPSGQGEQAYAWRDSIDVEAGTRASESATADRRILIVSDLSRISRPMRGSLRTRLRERLADVLLDWDGAVSRAWRGEDRGRIVVIGVSPDNVVRFVIRGNATGENVRRAAAEIERMAELSTMREAAALPPGARPTVAVADLRGVSVTSDEAAILTDRLRVELVRAGRFQVVERERMNAVLQEQGFQQSGACSTDECAVEMGRLLGAERIVAGTIGRIGRTYTITARMIDVGTGRIIADASHDCRCEIDDLLGGMAEIAATLARGAE